MSTALPAWVYRLITHLVENHDVEALKIVPNDAQIGAKAIADAARKRAGK